MNLLALAAAEIALEDIKYLDKSVEFNREGKQQLRQGFETLDLHYIDSAANFISVKVGDATLIYENLLRQGIITRPIAGYGMPEHLRVTVGLPAENKRFLHALKNSLT